MGTYINGLATYVIKLELRRELGGGSKGPQYSAFQGETVRVSDMSGVRLILMKVPIVAVKLKKMYDALVEALYSSKDHPLWLTENVTGQRLNNIILKFGK